MIKTILYKNLKFKIFKNEDKTNDFKYNVQVLHKLNNKFYYAGVGTFAKTKNEVKNYIKLKKSEV